MSSKIATSPLARFAARRKDAVREYRAFVEAGVPLGHRPGLVGGSLQRSLRGAQAATERGRGRGPRQAYDERILGSGEFVEALWAAAPVEDAPGATLSLEELTERVARAYGVNPVELCRQRRLPNLSDARAAICYLAVRHLGYKGVKIGRHLGLGRTGASAAVRRGQDIVRGDPALRDILGAQG